METVKEKGFGFSWADEVEREEEEEREKENQIQIQKDKDIEKTEKRTKPFGPARARAKISEEMGFNWRKLEQQFDFNSSKSTFRTSNKPKEINKKNPLILQTSKNKNLPIEDLVPPLKYPPKNINLVFEKIRKTHKDKPNTTTNPNFMPRHQTGTNRSTMAYRPVRTPNLNPVLADSHNGGTSSDIKKELIPVSNTNPNFKPCHQTGTNCSTMAYQPVPNSSLNPVLVDSHHGGKKILNSDPNIMSSYIKNELVPVSRSENQCKDKNNNRSKSNFVKKRKLKEGGEIVERRALIDLNSKFEKSICKTTESSNSYFGVLDLLEQSSDGKSASLKKRIKGNLCKN